MYGWIILKQTLFRINLNKDKRFVKAINFSPRIVKQIIRIVKNPSGNIV
jgi:hypothetical protein